MRRLIPPILILACFISLVVGCYGRALFRNEQFSYRDAAHFYYPLYHRVQQEWDAGRWPLWEPEENGGMPLMGNPTAAVLYPGKIIYAVLPYAWAARIYVVAHTVLAFGAMAALARSWKIGWVGSAIAGLSYAFGGPILFQYCNIIYLVGAAWLPLGFRATDRWLREGRRFALLELALVLAMETLGGDPECAYITGLCAAGYAAALAWRPSRPAGEAPRESPGNRWLVPAGLAAVAAWIVGTIVVAAWAPVARPKTFPPSILPWMPWVAPTVTAAWGLAALGLLHRWRSSRKQAPRLNAFVVMLFGLGMSAVLAAGLSAAQLFPVLEFTSGSSRAAAEGPHEIYPFSLQPWRIVELIWPNPFGTPYHGNRSWLVALPPLNKEVKIWVPTLYLGGLTLILALGAARLRARGDSPWRSWMTVVAVVTLLGSFGEFTSPLFYARYVSSLVPMVGPHDPRDAATVRFDHFLRDGDGSFYWFMTMALPGFRQFRFPAKLMTFTVMALAVLAGKGWDDLLAGDRTQRRRSLAWTTVLLLPSLFVLGGVATYRSDLVAWLEGGKLGSWLGPLDCRGAIAETLRGLFQGVVVLGSALLLVSYASRRPGPSAVATLLLLTADLGLANAKYVFTSPQALFETEPEVWKIIQKEEARHPSPDPFRVHRMPIWSPLGWVDQSSEDRVRDFVTWERRTLQPKYGIDLGVNFTLTIGVAELYDYEWFFGGFNYSVRGSTASSLGVEPGTKVVVYPRRSFDFWTTRYFVVPYFGGGWTNENRGFASFLDKTERVYPPADAFTGPDRQEKEYAWVRDHDFQVRRNLAVYPRAWVVHSARWLKAIEGMSRKDRARPLEEIMFSNDPLWTDRSRTVYDAHTVTWLDSADQTTLMRFLRNTATTEAEKVKVVKYEPDRVELEAHLETPGVVVLADVFYPGWSLTIDGVPAPVYRANRMMRGAAVEAGRHRLVYTFRPRSFQVGLAASAAGSFVFVALAMYFGRRPLATSLVSLSTPPGVRK